MWNKEREEIKNANIKKNKRKFYKEVKQMENDCQQQNIICKDEREKILTEEKDILLRWQQYFRSLLEDELQLLVESKNKNTEEEKLEDIYKPTYKEMIKVIRNIKSGKALGTDNMTVEMIRHGGPELLQGIFYLLIQICDQDTMPEEWETVIIRRIFKKGDRRDCNNYRGITFLNITYKIFTCLIYVYNRLARYSELTLGEYQAGFRPNRSTTDLIHS